MLPTTIIVTISTLFLVQQCLSSPVYTMQPAYITANIGTSGRNIRHLPCVSRRTGMSGTCMFAIDCLKANGTHLGTCIDRFYFGSCCHIEPPADGDPADNTIIDTALIPVRQPPLRLSSTSTTTTTTVPPASTPSTTTLGVSSTSTSKKPSSTTQGTTRKPLPTTQKVTSLSTQGSSASSHKVQTTKRPVVATTTKIQTTTESFKLSTFQSVDDGTQETTTTRNKLTTKPDKPPSKPVKPSSSTVKPRPRPTVKPTVNITRPVASRPTTSVRPTTRPTTRPTSRPLVTRPVSVKPSTKPVKPVVTTLARPTSVKPVKTTVSQRPITTTRPVTTQKITTASKLSTESRTTTRPTTVTKRTTTTTTTTAKPSTTSTTTTTTTPSTTTSSTTITPIKTSDAVVEETSSSPIISNEILASSTKIPFVETVNGNTATNEIEPVAKPTPEKKPEVTMATEISTTQSPGLVTWAMVNNEQSTKGTANETSEDSEDEWTPITPPDGWVLVPSLSTTTPQPVNEIKKPATSPSSPQTSPTSQPTQSTHVTTSSSQPTSPSPSPTSSPPPPPPSSSTTSPEPSPTSPTTLLSTSSSLGTSSEPTPSTAGFTATNVLSSTQGLEETGPGESDTETTMELVPLVNVSSSSSSVTTPSTVASSDVTTPSLATSTVANMSDFTDVCGRRMFPEPRIVGGEKSSFGRWPWQISLRQWKTSTYLHKCGAALLNENWAITAAHCVDNVPPSDLLLRLGEHDLSTDAEPFIHQERRVQIVASHPQFDPRTFEYDLALLRFYEPVTFQPNIIPVCVPQDDETFVGRSAYVTGWGRLYEDGPLPSVLQEVSVPVINNTVCEAMYRNAGYIEHIPNIFICAGWKHGGFDSCEGDSGGPMVIQRPDKRFLLAGVISWGIGCAEPNQPGVYTRISEFRDWINQILQF